MHWKQQELDTNTPRLNFLVAYPYCKPDVFEVLKNQTLPYRFLLDSGAFTAHNAGKVITLDDYCRFIEAMPIKPWRYFQLDVVGDPEKTARNYEKMLERGFTPVPVFTHNESLSHAPGALIYLQPISQGAEATKLCVETAMANDWRVSVQVHKYLAVR